MNNATDGSIAFDVVNLSSRKTLEKRIGKSLHYNTDVRPLKNRKYFSAKKYREGIVGPGRFLFCVNKWPY